MLVLKNRLTAEQRVELVHVSLMRNKMFALFAGLFMVGKTTVEDSKITAATKKMDSDWARPQLWCRHNGRAHICV